MKGLNEPEFDAMSDISQKSGASKTSYTMYYNKYVYKLLTQVGNYRCKKEEGKAKIVFN